MPRLQLSLVALLLACGLHAEQVHVSDQASPVAGQVISLDDSWLVMQLAEGGEERIPAPRVLEIDLAARRQDVPQESTVILWSGDRYRGTLLGGSRTTLRLASRALGELTLRLTEVRELLLRTSTWNGVGAIAGADEDVAYLTDGDHLTGVVESFSSQGVTLRSEALGQDHTFAFEELARLTFADLGRPAIRSSGRRRLQCHLLDGSRLSAGFLGFQKGNVTLVDDRGEEHRLPRESIATLFFLEGDFVFLSDLEPLGDGNDNVLPFPGVITWPHRRNEAVTGGPLATSERLFVRGLGVHSRSVLCYSLEGQPRRFLATVGLDSSRVGGQAEKPYASVRFRVRVGPLGGNPEDAPILHETPVLRQESGALDLGPIELGDDPGLQLILEVDHADNFHVQDRALWGAARLVP